MKKSLLSFLLTVLLILPLSSYIFSASAAYWQIFERYTAALDSGSEDEILLCIKDIENELSDSDNSDDLVKLLFPLQKAARIYEKNGYFKKSSEYYEKFCDVCRKLIDLGEDYSSYLKTHTMLYKHNSVKPIVFAETKNEDNIKYNNGRYENNAGVYQGMCDWFDPNYDNAKLIYVQFFDENISSFSWQLPYEDSNSVVLIALNLPNENYEDLRKIASGEYDDYIIENIEYLSSLNFRVFLRFAAEVNCWESLPDSKERLAEEYDTITSVYKNAFIRVSDFAHSLASNVSMVYSPNDISSFYFSPEDFYPGDEYVDWVGMSTYNNTYLDYPSEISDASDAYYCRGKYYNNQMIKISSVVEAFGNRKPIMISECGFSYNNSDNTADEESALYNMRFFYTYISRVYPEIKCVMYFNTNSSSNNYRLFGDNNYNNNLAIQYRELTSDNVAMSYVNGNSPYAGYCDIKNFNEIADKVNLSVYASFPSEKAINVEYKLDTLPLNMTSAAFPYKVSVNTENLSVGGHLLSLKISCDNTEFIYCYKLEKDLSSKISFTEIMNNFTDIKTSFWGFDAVSFCVSKGIFEGTSDSTFEPGLALSRATFVTILGRLTGINEEDYSKTSFSDVKKGKWYSPFVEWAKENNIVNGLSKELFGPDELITREQLCTMIVRYAKRYGITLSSSVGDKFADNKKISTYAYDAVYIAKASGLVEGKGNNCFDPKASSTRAEAAEIIKRFIIKYRTN